MSEEKERWIKSKVIIFFGLNNQFAGMYLVDTHEQVEMIKNLVYDFPYSFEIYEDIPRLTEVTSVNVDRAEKTVETEISCDMPHVRMKTLKHLDKDEKFFNKIEEIFGSS
jgi:hypothetical protein